MMDMYCRANFSLIEICRKIIFSHDFSTFHINASFLLESTINVLKLFWWMMLHYLFLILINFKSYFFLILYHLTKFLLQKQKLRREKCIFANSGISNKWSWNFGTVLPVGVSHLCTDYLISTLREIRGLVGLRCITLRDVSRSATVWRRGWGWTFFCDYGPQCQLSEESV